jgi:uracil-DNA glycosylase
MIDIDMAGELDSSWHEVLGAEFDKSYMCELRQFLVQQKDGGNIIYPPRSEWFSAFNSTAFNRVRVVILGQDPYHGPHQAHGLCFSVPPGVKIPPSLQNIYKELESDLGFTRPSHGCLSHWAELFRKKCPHAY